MGLGPRMFQTTSNVRRYEKRNPLVFHRGGKIDLAWREVLTRANPHRRLNREGHRGKSVRREGYGSRRESPKKTEGAERDGASRAEELPKTLVRRMVKEKLSEHSGNGDINLHNDALLAFSESARIFIHYLSATANDICKESRRQIVNADDVLMAIKDIEFPEFIEPLKASLDELRKKNAGKAKKADASKLEESNKRSFEGERSEAKEGSKKKKKGSKANAAAYESEK